VGLEDVGCYDAEVVSAAFEGLEEVGIGGGGYGGDGCVGEDEFVAQDGGGGPAVLGGHVGESAAEN